MTRPCIFEGCQRSALKRGYCNTHYNKLLLSGELSRRTVAERLWSRVDRSGGESACWVWTAHVTTGGYGVMSVDGRPRPAHRIAYELLVAPIPEDHFLDHICHQRRCVNPRHLRPATNAENMQNRQGPTRNSRTGIRGVTWNKRQRRYQAKVTVNGETIHGGFFIDITDAERAAIELRRKHLPFSREFAS